MGNHKLLVYLLLVVPLTAAERSPAAPFALNRALIHALLHTLGGAQIVHIQHQPQPTGYLFITGE